MSGYFLLASKSAGFTIHPWMRVPSLELYQISSVVASFFPVSTSSLTVVSCLSSGRVRAKVTTSLGLSDVLTVPSATPVFPMSLTVRTCAPFVTWRTCPVSVAKYRLRDPSFSTLK